MSASGTGALDPTLLNLFREEVRGHLQTLDEGLVGLEQRPEDLHRIEPLMRAAHSVKGAVRIAGLDPAVEVAHGLEECLVLAQGGRLTLTSAGLDVMLEAVDLLVRLTEAIGSPAGQAEHAAGVTDLLERLRALARGTHPGPAAVEKAERPATPEEEPPAEAAAPDAEQEPGADDEWRRPLLELFRAELVTHGQTLREGLGLLGEATETGAPIEPLLKAAVWVRSAARVVHIDTAARLALAVEERLLALRNGRSPAERDLAPLRRAADFLPLLGEAAAGPDLSSWLAEHEEEIGALLRQLRQPAPAGHKPDAPAKDNTPLARPAGAGKEAPAPDAIVPRPPAALPSTGEGKAAGEGEQVVRVTAQSLTRLMGLAGEALVQARWLQPFTRQLVHLKRRQARLLEALDELSRHLPPGRPGEAGRAVLTEVHEGLAACHAELDDRIGEFEDHARQADGLNSRLYREVIASRMRPFGDGTHGFARLLRDLAKQLGKKVRFEVVGETTEVDRDILDQLQAPLNHLLRNAVDHGLEPPDERRAAGKPETGSLRLEAHHSAGMLCVQVRDDGRGIAPERVRRKVIARGLAAPEMAAGLRDDELLEFLFLPGFSTAERVTDVSGRGVGLDVVRNMVRAVGGTVRIASRPGGGTTFHLQLPVTLSVLRAVLTEVAGEPYAFPHNRINRLLRLPWAELGSLQDRQFFEVDGRNVGVVLARQLFELGGDPPAGDDLFVVLFGDPAEEYGLVVDRFVGEQDLVVRPLDDRLGKVPNVSAAAILEDGEPVLIVDLDDVGRSIHKLLHAGRLRRAGRSAEPAGRARRRVLVVDDSITVREVQRQLLAGRGYEVEVAVDGMDGWNTVRRGGFDLVVSDVDMPRLDGLGLVRLIRADPQLQGTPVVIVSYKDREDHRLAGLEAGANYYLTKSSFHDETFLRAVQDLIGDPGP
jgi:two-component system sensor histidine kinase and response regulator WspE